MSELEYYKKRAQKLEDEKAFNEQMSGCLPLLLFALFVIGLGIWG